MAKIDIRRKHRHSIQKARAAVDKTAAAIGRKFDIVSEWSGNTLEFSRAGVSGAIHVSATQIHVVADLGFLLGMLKPAIEREIEEQLDKQFG
jgi:putative polyhydroxyalkanoate system protein